MKSNYFTKDPLSPGSTDVWNIIVFRDHELMTGDGSGGPLTYINQENMRIFKEYYEK